ncbi:hypothetical protein NG99_11345 [Erwinia typographi]|uniref:DUF2913 domain-containing protein n=1 Tax=Erwinia typographi TaxID=371042 RepID=A0A0A3Z3U0_9GAMM|nr:DUF2913 family protein [Erwinia typographi]KGT93500.1 hypothetical protein NG99_11345 [Erwinia typographi]
MSRGTLTEKTGHLAWCGLVALQLARQDGRVRSESQENVFLTRWLATALKQHRFPREVAPDITWLLNQGRQAGVGAGLKRKLSYLWQSCTGELAAQNDLFRLTYAMETAKEMHWTYRLLGEREWSGRNAVTLNPGVNGIFLSRASLEASFSDDGTQTKPLMARLTGHIPGLEKLLNRCGWLAEACMNNDIPFLFRLETLPDGNRSPD